MKKKNDRFLWHRATLNFGQHHAKKAALFVFALMFTITSALAQISGTNTACQGAAYNYSVPAAEGQFYTWTVAGGQIVSPTSTENQVTVYWNTPGTGTLTLVTQPSGATTTYDVSVVAAPTPFLVPNENLYCSGGEDYVTYKIRKDLGGKPYSFTTTPDYDTGLPCVVACENSSVTYTTPAHAGSTYTWSVTGAISYVASNNTITVVWGAPGFGLITVTETNTAGCSVNDNICIEILDSPEALFAAVPAPVSNFLTICSGQTVYFTDQSVGGTQWAWDFGDGYISSTQNPDHTYLLPGTYTVTLTVSNYEVGTVNPIFPSETGGGGGEVIVIGGGGRGTLTDGGGTIRTQDPLFPEADFTCNCTDTYTMTVIVEEFPAPIIECVSTVCAGDTATYTTPANCPSLSWTATNGTVIAQSGNSVTVVWGDGLSGAGYLTMNYGSCPGFCDGPAVVRIPIIPTALAVTGADTVCLNSVHLYSVPEVAGVTYTWNITDGQVLDGQGTNTVTVFWDGNSPGTYNVSVTYGNDLLACGGTASMDVLGVPELVLETSVRTFCEGTNTAASPITAINNNSLSPAAANWSVITPAGALLTNVQTNSTQFTTYNFGAGPGTYLVIAKPASGAWCNEQVETSITIVARPSAPAGILGDQYVCPNTPHTYAVVGTIGNATYNWTITNTGNGAPYAATGETVNVTWGSGEPYSLSVTQSYADLAGCTSQPFTLTVYDKSLLLIADILGPDTVCLGGTADYSLSTVIPDVEYKWEIITPELGNILTPDNATAAQINWGSNNNTAVTATIKVSMTICDKTFSRTKEVYLRNYAPTITGPSEVCENEPVIFNGPSSAGNDGAVVYDWSLGNGESGAAESVQTTYTGAGSYVVSLFVINKQNCTAELTHPLTVNPSPIANITTPDRTEFLVETCGVDPVSVTMYAMQNVANTYTYEWFEEGNPTLLGTSNPFTVNAVGSYYAVVTDATSGCKALSDNIPVSLVGCGCAIVPPYTADFTSVKLEPTCNEVAFTPNLTGNIAVSSWWFRDPKSGSMNTSTAINPTHAFAEAGYFNVRLYFSGPDANGGTAVCYVDRQVFLPIVANFEHEKACVTDQMVTILHDESGYFNDGTVSSREWTITGPGGTFTSTDANPELNLSGGVYNVSLTVSSATYGVTCTTTGTIDVPASPVAAFDFVNGVCPGDLVTFTDQSTGSDLTYWSWGFPSGIAPSSNQNPVRKFTNPGANTIVLTVVNKWGCSSTAARNLTVGEPENGEITVNGSATFCAGGSVTLTAPNGGGWVWSNGATTQSIVVTTSGVYTVELDGTNGCRYSTAPVTVTVNPKPTPVVSGNTNLCAGELVNLTTAAGYNSYAWQFNADPVSDLSYTSIAGATNTQSFYADLARSGDYRVTVTNQFSCTGTSAPYHVGVNPVPGYTDIAVDQAGPYCEGTIYTFTVVNPNPIMTYVWSTGQIGDTIRAREAGVYSVTAYNPYGCSSDGAQIIINEVPDVSAVMTGCYEICRSDFPITVPGPAGYRVYQWYHDGAVFSTNQDLTANEFGTYYLVLTNDAGCTATSGEVIITPLAAGTVDLSATIECCTDRIICQGTSATLPIHFTGTGPYTFTYTNGSSTYTVTTSSNPYNLVVTPSVTTTYKLLTVTSANESGCFEVCGEATVAVKDCTPLTNAEKKGKTAPQDCSINCFSATVNGVTTGTDGCKTVTMTISCTGTCQAALSNFGISVGCGEISGMSNSMGFPMSISTTDPNTGLNGIKVDNVSGICSSGGVSSFIVTYTLCPDPNDCGFALCAPVVAFKAGTCTYYSTASVPSNYKSLVAQGEVTETEGMSLRVYPNPFAESTQVELHLDETSDVNVEVLDVLGQRMAILHQGTVEAGTSTYEWQAVNAHKEVLPGGIYYIRTTVNGVSTHTKVMYVK